MADSRPGDGSSVLYVDSLAYMLATHLVHTYGVVPTHAGELEPVLTGRGVRRIPDLVEAHLADDLSVDVLAREAGLAPRAFARAFRRQFGTSVHQYVLERRLEKAKELLAATDESIVEIALRTGFSSQSHLATAFRKLTGFTPKQYRKSSAGKAAIIASSAGKAGRGLSTSGEAGHAKTAGASGR